MAVLKVTNIPTYIVEAEFKRVWTQPGLECQSCTFTKDASAETVGYLHFATPLAAGRVQQMYNGWQGYGNPEGIRIESAEDASGRVKREREDAGADDQTFKQSRPMPGAAMGFGANGTAAFGSGGQGLGRGVPGDAPYDPQQPGFAPEPASAVQRYGSSQSMQPANAFGYGTGSQVGKPAFMGMPSQNQQGVSSSQPFSVPASAGMGRGAHYQQQRADGQPKPGQLSYGGGQQAGPQQAYSALPNSSQQNQPQLQAPQHTGNFGTQAYDPRIQHGPGPANPAPPDQAHQQQLPQQPHHHHHHQPQQGHQPQQHSLPPPQQPQQMAPLAALLQGQALPQQVASLADVLGPLLQQSQAAAQGAPGGHGQPHGAATQLGGQLDQLQQLIGQAQQQGFQTPSMQMPAQMQQAPQLQGVPQQQYPGQPAQQFPGAPPPQMQAPPPQHALQGPPPAGPSPPPVQGTGPLQAPGPGPKQDGFSAAEPLPADAAQTLYVDGMPRDVSRREMAHVFRPFEGFREIRMVEKKDKMGGPIIMSFAEFDTPVHAHHALKMMQGYQMDLATPNEGCLRISFAKPFKPNDPRSRMPPGGPPPGGPMVSPNAPPRHAGGAQSSWREDHHRMPARDEMRSMAERRDRAGPPRRFSDRPDRWPDDRRPAAVDRRR